MAMGSVKIGYGVILGVLMLGSMVMFDCYYNNSWRFLSLSLSSFATTPNTTLSTLNHVMKRTPLQRLEAGLARVRGGLRRLALANVTAPFDNTSMPNEDNIYGPLYKNAAFFQKSYNEMERRLKIFVYAEGEEPLVHNGPCKEIYAVEGRFIQELSHYGGREKNPFVTTDPRKAHLFFLPFSVAMMVTYLHTPGSRDMSPLLRYVKDYVDVISTKYPYWNVSAGADHFMLSCHDWATHVSTAHPELKSKAIRVLCNANITEGYIPYKDVSLPEINLIGGYSPTSADFGGLRPEDRPYLAFFAGGDHGPVRPHLYQAWEGSTKDPDILVYKTLPANFSYIRLMKSSKFCLCPGGYEVNSPRLVESIYYDCVPVIIADKFILPFSDVLDWRTFALHLPEREIPNLKTILTNVLLNHTTGLLEIGDGGQPYYHHYDYYDMVKRVAQVRHHFLFNQPPQRYDVFHMILHSVWLRRLNFRLA